MKIKYKFLTGEVTEVEVTEEIGNVILESRRKEHASVEKNRYHAAFSLNDVTYEGEVCSSLGSNPVDTLIKKERNEECNARLSKLTAVQRNRYEMLVGDEMSIADIARSENASFNSVKESIESARRKLKKLL